MALHYTVGPEIPCTMAPRGLATPSFVAILVQLSLLLPIEQRVVIVHAHEFGPPLELCYVLHLRKLVAPHAARAQVSNLATFDQIMQRLHCLFDRHTGVEAMYLQNIHIARPQPFQTRFDSIIDGRPREPTLVDVVLAHLDFIRIRQLADVGLLADNAVAPRHQHQLVARDGTSLNGVSDGHLVQAVRVRVGRVPRVQAPVIRRFEQVGELFLVVHGPRLTDFVACALPRSLVEELCMAFVQAESMARGIYQTTLHQGWVRIPASLIFQAAHTRPWYWLDSLQGKAAAHCRPWLLTMASVVCMGMVSAVRMRSGEQVQEITLMNVLGVIATIYYMPSRFRATQRFRWKKN